MVASETTSWQEKLNEFGKKRTPCFFLVDFQGIKGEVYPLETLLENGIRFDFSGLKTEQKEDFSLKINPYYIDYEEFEKSFDIVHQHLKRGDSFLTNLTFATPIAPIDLQQVYAQARAKYKILYKDKWVCFSPESFVKIIGNQIFTYPMKGTIDASLPNAEKVLLENKKEVAEHYTIVDLLRNDLSQIAKNVEVSRFRYLEKIQSKGKEILQASSEIVGILPKNWASELGTLLGKILPAGSISGAPKCKTMEIIAQAETHERGFYTGIAGLFDGISLNTCVLIRFIERIDNQYFYKSGGGITAQSNPQEEYAEIQHKIYIPI